MGCEEDYSADGLLASEACPGCGACEAAQVACVGDEATFMTKYGPCSSYAVGGENHDFCAEDGNDEGLLAGEVCPGCGACVSGASFAQTRHRSRRAADSADRTSQGHTPT